MGIFSENIQPTPNPVVGFAGGFQQALMGQLAQKQALQMAMAQEAGKAQIEAWTKMQDPIARALTVGKLGELGFPVNGMQGMSGMSLGNILQGNPYASTVFPGGMSAPSQPSPMQGTGAAMQPQPMGAQAMQAVNAPSPIPGSFAASQFGPNNLVQEKLKMGPFGPMPGEFTNLDATAQAGSASKYGSEMGGAQATAEVGSARDKNQLAMIAQTLKNLNQIHADLSSTKGGALGPEPWAGSAYGQFAANNAKFIPQAGGLQNKFAPSDIQNKVGQFISNRNEALVKLQPILSQQFGQAGSVRIMESLLNLTGSELGDLTTPHAQFEGQVTGTLKNMYRIQQASDQYLADLKSSGKSIPQDPNEVVNGIYSKMSDLTPAQDKQLNSLISSTLGKSEGKAQEKAPVQNQTKTLDKNTAMMFYQQAGGNKDKARQMAQQAGYSF